MQLPAAALAGLENVINRYLRLDPVATRRLATLNGRCIAIDLRGTGLLFYILPHEHGIRLQQQYADEADTILRGTPLGMARLGLGGSTEQTLFSGTVVIDGDVDTGQAFKSILDDIDIDWEEQLSRLTGDVIAHQVGNALRHAGRTFNRNRSTLQKNVGEYLQEEIHLLPARIETENFSADVTRCSMDIDRLAARVKRLQDKGRELS